MEADLQSKPAVACDQKSEAELRALVREREAELAERKRFDEELYSLVHTLEKRLTETSVQLTAARQELRLAKQLQTENEQEITRLTSILVRQQDGYATVNQELDCLSYAITHDLRAPIRRLLGFTTALTEDFGDTLETAAQAYLQSINRAAQMMDAQVQALLTLSRVGRQELRLSKVDLGEIARQCAASLQGSAPGRNVSFHIGDDLVVEADETLMRAALENLVGNAWKYTRNKEAAVIEFGRRQEGGATVYFLKDNGIGFDMRYAERLFGPFQRMHSEREFEGTGIGLATVQRILHRHGGRIWAEAQVDAGATFYFTVAS